MRTMARGFPVLSSKVFQRPIGESDAAAPAAPGSAAAAGGAGSTAMARTRETASEARRSIDLMADSPSGSSATIGRILNESQFSVKKRMAPEPKSSADE